MKTVAEIKAVTQWVSPDEKCYGLFEGPAQVPQLRGTASRWVQDVTVIRGDRRAHYIIDFGPAEDFKDVTTLIMPSVGGDTVAQLQAHAEKNRHDGYWASRSKEMLAGSTLLQDCVQQYEEIWAARHNTSVFGPGVTRQRNGHPQLDRLMKERRNNGA